MMPLFSCATCVFFAPHRPNWTDQPTGRGQCRAHAPVLDKTDEGRIRTLWPMVHEDNYCGDHAEVDVQVAEEQLRPRPALPEVVERAPAQTGPAWRCENCGYEEPGVVAPDRCVACSARTFAKVTG
jgi:hypothetical protein